MVAHHYSNFATDSRLIRGANTTSSITSHFVEHPNYREMNEYNYETWLAGHASRKSMMQKLERSLIPFELFAMMPLKNGPVHTEGQLLCHYNRYNYAIKYDYEHFGKRIYDVNIECIDLNNSWDNPLMGYNRFKVVMDEDRIATIYAKENFFREVIDAFEREDVDFLSEHRSEYVKNLLARYIMLRLMADHSPGQQLLTCVTSREGHKLTAISASANKSSVILYAFTKEEAIQTAHHYDGIAKNLIVVFSLNRNFNEHGNTISFETATTRVISIHQFCRTLALDMVERLYAERKILFLASFLYQQPLNWDVRRVEQVVSKPPFFGVKPRKYNEGRRKYRNRFYGKEPWWSRPSSALLEDALNVIDIEPIELSDIFHFLCAATLVNAYVNRMNFIKSYPEEYIRRMFTAKQQIFDGLKSIARQKIHDVQVVMDKALAVMVNIRINGLQFQFSYRGASDQTIREFLNMHVPQNGRFTGHSLQAIATALYQYSHILRRERLKALSQGPHQTDKTD